MIDSLKSKKIILDTNVLVSVLLSHKQDRAKLRHLLEYILEYSQLYASYETFQELENVINRDKFQKYLPKVLITTFLDEIKKEIKFIEPNISIDACRDSNDNKFLELAKAANIDVIITGDKDLLDLNPYEDTMIITPNEAFTIIENNL